MVKTVICPLCRSNLKKEKKYFVCEGCAEKYEARQGRLILWKEKFEDEGLSAIKKDLAFTKAYAEALSSTPEEKIFSENEEFFERERGRSLAAKMVDEKALNTFINLSGSLRGFRVLDVGIGGGKEAQWLFEKGVLEIVGVDISEELLSRAQERLKGKNISFIVANAERLPFPDKSFDLVFFMGALHHFYDPQKALKEACRVGKRVGLVGEPSSMGPLKIFLDLIGWGTEYGGLKTKRFSPQKIEQFFKERNFNVLTKTNFIWFPFSLFSRFKNNLAFLTTYFNFLKILDKIMGMLGHNLTVYAFSK